ncbi:glutaredoxin family protein [Cryobacterium sp. Y62]|uniref:glutaredoxin family protein n=1 Tax=Cryobacterium sp. Y62 TaxID=2048284 RepID=UPI000CE38C23|nr:glutaredoxin family protein [Cryobacterium sp. Y62]
MAIAHLTLIGKPGCHLCDDARDVVGSVVAKLTDDASAPTITLEERSILDDADLHERYFEDIPVLLINGKMHNYWRIDPVRLRTALLEVS